jgi:hypothetical protein
MRECSESMSVAAWSVLEEDGVLGLGAEVRHGVVVRGGERRPVRRSEARRDGRFLTLKTNSREMNEQEEK